eukprot:2368711-Prymnesium_polylepis.1
MPFAPPIGFDGHARMTELCPETCAAAGIHVAGCTPPPSPPAAPELPTAPPVPPLTPGVRSYTTVVTEAQLRSALDAHPLQGSLLSLYLPPGIVLMLAGAPVTVKAMNVTLVSDGVGAVLDAQYLSPVLTVARGACLQLKSLTLANGYSVGFGGSVYLSDSIMVGSSILIANSTSLVGGGALYLSSSTVELNRGSHIINSTTREEGVWAGHRNHGGAILVGQWSTMILDGGSIKNSYAQGQGGAFATFGILGVSSSNGPTVIITNHSSIVNSRCGAFGGTMAIYGSGNVLVSNGSSIVDSRSGNFGGMLNAQ